MTHLESAIHSLLCHCREAHDSAVSIDVCVRSDGRALVTVEDQRTGNRVAEHRFDLDDMAALVLVKTRVMGRTGPGDER